MARHREGNLFLKFRVVPTRRMQVKEAVRLLKQALRTGYVPEGIEIIGMDWAKGSGHKFNTGEIPGHALEEMRAFYAALMQADIRLRKAE